MLANESNESATGQDEGASSQLAQSAARSQPPTTAVSLDARPTSPYSR